MKNEIHPLVVVFRFTKLETRVGCNFRGLITPINIQFIIVGQVVSAVNRGKMPRFSCETEAKTLHILILFTVIPYSVELMKRVSIINLNTNIWKKLRSTNMKLGLIFTSELGIFF